MDVSLVDGTWLTRVVCSVPISKLPQLIQETHEDIVKSGLKCTMVGHAGDGARLVFSPFYVCVV